MAPEFRTRPDGSRYPITPRRGRGTVVVTVAAALALAGGGAAGTGGGLAAEGAASASDASAGLPGNRAGDVTDALPGRDLATRRTQARSSARRGRTTEAWRRLSLKQLTRRVERAAVRELDCVAASTGQVRAFLVETPCTSLDRMLLTVGDGRGNAAVVSVVRIGFATSGRARAFKRIEDEPGSGDVRPLEMDVALRLADVRLTAQHYRSRLDGRAVVVAEAETATGRIDAATLDAIADVASYLPLT